MEDYQDFNQEEWQQVVDFHGHACPGLVIGYKAARLARRELGVKTASDEELVCVTENDACGVDAVQWLTGCTFGKGNLLYRPVAKQAFSFFRRDKDNEGQTESKIKDKPQAIRLVLEKSSEWPEDREEALNWLLAMEANSLFQIKKPPYELPARAQIFSTLVCEECGEGAAEYAFRLQDDKRVCLDCYDGYDREVKDNLKLD